MSETQPADGQVEGSAFLFRKPELLTAEKHGGLGITRPEKPYQFCAEVNAVPVTISEIAMAQKHYPIIFSENNPLPMAVVGLVENKNLFVDDQGEWAENAYIPGYVRRYPFALAADQKSDRMAMIVDTDYEGFTKGADVSLFEGTEASEATKQAMEYCKSYEQDRLMTAEFAKRLKEYDLIKPQVAQFTPQGQTEPQPFANYFGIEEPALNELSDEKYLELRKSNMLPVLHASLMSMGNWRSLMDRRAKRYSLTSENIMQPIS